MNRGLLIRLGVIVFCFYTIAYILSQVLHLTLDEVDQLVESYGFYAPIAYSLVLLLGLTIPFNPVSDFLVVNVAAFLFPPIVSIFFTFISHSIALTINYHIGRRYGKKIIQKVATDKNSEFVKKILAKLNLSNIFILRFFLPTSNIIGVEIISYAAGSQRIPFLKFFLVSIIPWTTLSVLYFLATSYIREKTLSLYFIPAAILVGLPLFLYFILRQTHRRSREKSELNR